MSLKALSRRVAVLATLALSATVLQQTPATATLKAPAAVVHGNAPAARITTPVAHHQATESAPQRHAAANAAAIAARSVTWPHAGIIQTGRRLPTATAPVTLTAGNPTGLTGRVVAHTTLRKAGIDGVAVALTSAAGHKMPTSTRVGLNYARFANAFGADWADRLTATVYPACVLTTPAKPACATGQTLPVTRNRDKSTITASVTNAVPALSARTDSSQTTSTVTSSVVVFAAAATSTTGNGDFAATPLSASASWTAGGASGDFQWSYPMRTPPANAGPSPDLTLAYSAQSVDGRTASSNNQAGWAGEGFSLSESYISRDYASCHDDSSTGNDLCWKTDNATLVLNGQANQLIAASDGTWRLSHDNGARVRRLKGTSANNGDNDKEYWEVTEADGTKYYFGLSAIPSESGNTNSVWTVPVAGNQAGEPCHASTFATSFCAQAWRWNLDYVVDPAGNAMSYWYSSETNYYHGTSSIKQYVRGGYLNKIDYGLRDNTTAQTAPMQVTFTSATRCLAATGCGSYTKSGWPDTPYDEICSSTDACTANTAPTFFSRFRLADVTTNVRKAGAYEPVDRWTFTDQFLNSGDTSDADLWLASIQHAGLVGGTTTLPATTFTAAPLANRVDNNTDGLAPLTRYRIRTITSETGAVTTVNYADSDCVRADLPTPDSNTQRCFPQKWTPPGNTSPLVDWFNKYVVSDVTTTDTTALGAPVTTYYDYQGGAGWAYNQDKLIPDGYRTWSIWRGYGKVITTVGDPNQTSIRSQQSDVYFRGLDGDKQSSGTPRSSSVTDSTGRTYSDSRQLAGFDLETTTYDGAGGPVASATITVPWSHLTAGSGDQSAYYVAPGDQDTRTALSTGGFRHRDITTTYDPATGEPTRVSDSGDTSVNGDETCTATEYADTQTTSGAWFVGFPSRVVISKGSCGSDALTPTEETVLSDQRTRYDSQAQGAAPTIGLVTATDRLFGFAPDGSEQYQTMSTTAYDANGRPTSVTTPVNNTTTTTTTAYTMSTTDGTLTSTKVVKDAGGKAFATTTTNAPEWGQATQITDPNGRINQAAYDPLGRVVSSWLANRGSAATPNTTYTYNISNTTPSSVTTSTLNTDASAYVSSVSFYDALLRPRETQSPSPSGGRLIAATDYDGRGLVSEQADGVYANGAPSTSFAQFDEGAVPKRTLISYDGLGRQTKSTLTTGNTVRWSTTTSYDGLDSTTVTPPAGAAPVTTTTDVRGRVVSRVEHGTPDLTTSESYDLLGNLTKLASPAGTWTYTYDLRGRKISVDDPETGTTRYTYTDADQVATATDARGKSTLTVYDSLGRPTALYDGTTADASSQLGAWTYDMLLGKGQIATTTRYVGGTTGTAFTEKVTGYDTLYHATGTTFTITNGATSDPDLTAGLPTSFTSSATYNVDQTLHTTGLPKVGTSTSTALSAETLTYGYNSVGLPTSVQGRTAIIQDTTYDQEARPATTTIGTGSAAQAFISNEYDEGTDRLTRQFVTTNLSDQVVSDHHYTYDASGNTLEDADTTNHDYQCYGYDDHDRINLAWTPASNDCTQTPSQGLLGGPAPYLQSWTYTDAGLRHTQTTTTPTGSVTDTYAYPATGSPHADYANQITRESDDDAEQSSQTLSYGTDDSGNTTAEPDPGATSGTDSVDGPGEQALTWDAEGDLASLTRPNGDATRYVYGLDGTLLLSSSPTTVTLFLDQTQVTYDKAGATLSAQRNYETPAGPVATRFGDGDTQIVFLVPNAQDTAGIALDAATLTPTYRWMTPFGEKRGAAPSAWPNDRGFLAAKADADTGLTSVGQRQYDPTTGRFISADPLLDTTSSAQMLGYEYGDNNPVLYADPDGAFAIEERSSAGAGPKNPASYPPGVPVTPADYDSWETDNQQQEVSAAAHSYAVNPDKPDRKLFKDIGIGTAKIFGAVTGITDLRNCVQSPSAVGCGLAAVGMVPAGKVAKLAKVARYAEDADRAAEAGSRLGWSTSDDIYSLTKAGNTPSWSTVRARFWKNEAANPQYGSWSDENLARMQRGLAPQRYNPDKGGLESMELSHEPIPYRDGGTEVIPRWPQDHAAIDPYRYPGY